MDAPSGSSSSKQRRIYRCSKCGQPKKGHTCVSGDQATGASHASHGSGTGDGGRGDVGVLTRRGRLEMLASEKNLSDANLHPAQHHKKRKKKRRRRKKKRRSSSSRSSRSHSSSSSSSSRSHSTQSSSPPLGAGDVSFGDVDKLSVIAGPSSSNSSMERLSAVGQQNWMPLSSSPASSSHPQMMFGDTIGSDSKSSPPASQGKCEWCFRTESSCEREPCACRKQVLMVASDGENDVGATEMVDDSPHDESTWYSQVLSPNSKKRSRGEDSASEEYEDDVFPLSSSSSLFSSSPAALSFSAPPAGGNATSVGGDRGGPATTHGLRHDGALHHRQGAAAALIDRMRVLASGGAHDQFLHRRKRSCSWTDSRLHRSFGHHHDQRRNFHHGGMGDDDHGRLPRCTSADSFPRLLETTNRSFVGYCRICEGKLVWGADAKDHFLSHDHWITKRSDWFAKSAQNQQARTNGGGCGDSVDYSAAACVIPQEYFIMSASSIGGRYWVCFKVPCATTIQQLDHFLRDIWLAEPCGHTSHFTIDSSRHQQLVMLRADPIKALLESDRTHSHTSTAPLGSLVGAGDALDYVYDPACPTNIHLEVLGVRTCTQDSALELIGPAEILARNMPPQALCQAACDATGDGAVEGRRPCMRPATRICLACDSPCVLYCADHADRKCCSRKKLPLLNSPRVGHCAYDGKKYPANDLPPPRPSELVEGLMEFTHPTTIHI